ncbi:MAG: hypothetical protein KJP23_10405 [Deltaproteobacteria bacterium]|nr:hypothetical protein [Deltaproteobacteria bacterium]
MGFDQSSENQSIKKSRKGKRHQHFRKIILEIYPQSSVNYPIILEGYSNNFFIGGTCIVLDTKDVNISKSVASFNKTIKNSMVKLSFPNEGLELKISGKIAWTHEVSFRNGQTLALGIQFQGLSPKLRGMLFVLADSSGNP